jgi:restriction endonuclease Mrr
VDQIEGKEVVPIDDGRLADLTIEQIIGVPTTMTYESKKVSSDFFNESEE